MKRNVPAEEGRRDGARLLTLIVLAVLAAGWLAVAVRSAINHHTNYRQPAPFSPPPPQIVPSVVFILIDGLTCAQTSEMRCFHKLSGHSARAVSRIALPSVSQPSWTTLVSGAPPEINGAAPFNAPYEGIQPMRVDSVFSLAHRQGLSTALCGNRWWLRMVVPRQAWAHPSDVITYSWFCDNFDAVGDRATAEQAQSMLPHHPHYFMVYFGECDEVGHDYGASSGHYHAAQQRTDALVCTLLDHIDLQRTTVVITSDHGHLRGGGHGGNEPSVINAPLVFAGARVHPGSYGTIPEEDICMTVCALLGLSPPRSGMGNARYEMFSTSGKDEALGIAGITEARLRQASASAAAERIPPPPASLQMQAKAVRHLLTQGLYEQATVTSRKILSGISRYQTQQLRQQRHHTILKTVPVVALLALFLLGLARRLGLVSPAIIATSLCGILAAELVYRAAGYTTSISTLSSVGLLPRFALIVLLASAISILSMALIAWRLVPSSPRSVWQSLEAASAACVIFYSLTDIVLYACSGDVQTWNFIAGHVSFLIIANLFKAISLAVLIVCIAVIRGAALRWRKKTTG